MWDSSIFFLTIAFLFTIHRTKSFPGVGTGSDHDLMMKTFRISLKKTRKPAHSRLGFEKLRKQDSEGTFYAICISLREDVITTDIMIITCMQHSID